MSVPLSSIPQPDDDDLSQCNFVQGKFVQSKEEQIAIIYCQLGDLLHDPRRLQEAVTWHLHENEQTGLSWLKRGRNEALCQTLCLLQAPLVSSEEAAHENANAVHGLLLASCSVIHYFALNSKIEDPFPAGVYDLLNSVLQLVSVYNREYSSDTIARRHLAMGLSYLSQALSTDCDLGRWIPETNLQPTRTKIIELIGSALSSAIEFGLPEVLPEADTFSELSVLNEEIKIVGALRLYELSDYLACLMRRFIEMAQEAHDVDSGLEYPDMDDHFSYGLEDLEWHETDPVNEDQACIGFLYSDLLGSLVDSFGRVVECSRQEDLVEDMEAIYLLLTSHHPSWPAWPHCLRGYLKLSSGAIENSRDLITESLIPAVLEGQASPQVIERFIAKDWQAEELLCHTLQAMSITDFIRFREAIVLGSGTHQDVDYDPADLVATMEQLYLRKRPSYYSLGFGF